MPNVISSISDGPRLTVSLMMKSPTTIPRRVISKLDQQFLVDAILRKGNDAPSGVVQFWESTPLYAQGVPGVVEEFGEIPTTNGSLGIPRVVRTVRRALGIRVSKQMVDRNDVDGVNTQIEQLKNTMIRAWEDAFLSALISNGGIQTVAAAAVWGGGSSAIRKDVNGAKFLIENASSNGNGQNGSDKFGYSPDTLVISTVTKTDFLNSNEVSLPYVGNIADENLLYTGKLPNKFLDLDVVTSWRLDTYAFGAALVMQRKVVGGISDERGLSATPMYGEGGGPNGGKTESWRSDTTRQSAIFIDQPLAACLITGVHA